MPKKLTGKKVYVLKDELKIDGGGIYCILPFETIDDDGNAVFKIGMALNFEHRMEQYHTYFPEGFYYQSFLINPPVRGIGTRSRPATTKKAHYLKIENFIINEIINRGGKRIYSTTRNKKKNENNEGETEWIYTNEDTINNAFVKAEKKFSGKVELFHLNDINKTAKEREKKSIYTGEIHFV